MITAAMRAEMRRLVLIAPEPAQPRARDDREPAFLRARLHKVLENGHYVFKQVREFAGH